MNNTSNEGLIFRNLQGTSDIDKLCGKKRDEEKERERERVDWIKQDLYPLLVSFSLFKLHVDDYHLA